MKNTTPLDLLYEFERAYSRQVNRPFSVDALKLRLTLITEEFEEVRKATVDLINDGFSIENKANYLKELCDLLYVIYGSAATLGLPIDEAFNRVHDSNMSKLGADGKPIIREDGKILKGPNYWTPDIEGLFE